MSLICHRVHVVLCSCLISVFLLLRWGGDVTRLPILESLPLKISLEPQIPWTCVYHQCFLHRTMFQCWEAVQTREDSVRKPDHNPHHAKGEHDFRQQDTPFKAYSSMLYVRNRYTDCPAIGDTSGPLFGKNSINKAHLSVWDILYGLCENMKWITYC